MLFWYSISFLLEWSAGKSYGFSYVTKVLWQSKYLSVFLKASFIKMCYCILLSSQIVMKLWLSGFQYSTFGSKGAWVSHFCLWVRAWVKIKVDKGQEIPLIGQCSRMYFEILPTKVYFLHIVKTIYIHCKLWHCYGPHALNT